MSLTTNLLCVRQTLLSPSERRPMTKILQGSRILLAFVAITLLASGSSLYAEKPPSDPPPDPPPVNYALQRNIMPADHNGSIPHSRNINDQGEIVGYYDSLDGGVTPYYYDINSGESELTNLNDMTLNLDPDYDDVPAGWYIYRAFDINNLGDICGALALSERPRAATGIRAGTSSRQRGAPASPSDPRRRLVVYLRQPNQRRW